ncbi:hypothetical protein [Acuticoccus kandeliae]|uniref:AprA-related methyltransferase n=1 Tax=Acuticoccus kandeliae TaxID=2073160 RepID=UPI000D3E329D|nr:hypothetical protein [Acuticoccus kandeliae]
MSRASAWASLCHHTDGIATGTLLEALHANGAMAALARGPLTHVELAGFGLGEGDAALALKLLVGQGIAAGSWARAGLTPYGEAVAANPQWFDGARQSVRRAEAWLAGETPAPTPPPAGAPPRVRQQRLGPEAAALWFHLSRAGLPEGEGAVSPEAFAVLEAVGWMEGACSAARLTEDGRHAVPFACQYAYPLSYLATFERVADLIRGFPAPTPPAPGEEAHVDRALDIAFSGDVFNATCREPFLDAVLPRFDAPLEVQPAALVDTGSGDGTVLAVTYEAIRTRTLRGRHLDRRPLTLAGVEYNSVAERATAARLATLDAPFVTIAGDIGEPGAIAEALSAQGVDAADALHVNKSVLHNRRHKRPGRILKAPATEAVFTGRDGRFIPADEAYSALVALFEAWRPLIARHGMVSIEAHTVNPTAAACHIGRSLVTSLDAGHGFSRQYLVEIGVHRAAAAEAGLATRARVDLGAAMMGEPILSVDDLIPAEGSRR